MGNMFTDPASKNTGMTGTSDFSSIFKNSKGGYVGSPMQGMLSQIAAMQPPGGGGNSMYGQGNDIGKSLMSIFQKFSSLGKPNMGPNGVPDHTMAPGTGKNAYGMWTE